MKRLRDGHIMALDDEEDENFRKKNTLDEMNSRMEFEAESIKRQRSRERDKAKNENEDDVQHVKKNKSDMKDLNNSVNINTQGHIGNQVSNAQANTQANNNNSLFTPINKGPYGVWLKKIKTDNNELNAYKVGSILFKKYKNILDIRRKDKFKVEVMCKTIDEANRLIQDKELVNYNLEVFIPGHRKSRKGLIKRIPVDISEEEILSSIESSVPVQEIRRLNRRNRQANSDKDKWLPSESILITFVGQDLPKEIYVFKVRSSVEPYVSKPLQCFNCFKFGHTSKNCKGKKICIMCGNVSHESTQCKNGLSCTNCKEAHKSIDSSCKVYKDYTRINILMAYDNLSFIDARKIIMGDKVKESNNLLKTKENFPDLGNRKTELLKKYSHVACSIKESSGSQNKDNTRNRENLTETKSLETPNTEDLFNLELFSQKPQNHGHPQNGEGSNKKNPDLTKIIYNLSGRIGENNDNTNNKTYLPRSSRSRTKTK